MQDGAAQLLQRHLSKEAGLSPTERRVFQNAFDHLTSRDPTKAWTSGQWMTERTGGSDVSQTETVATYDPYPDASSTPFADVDENVPLGPWSISGFKWFSSATDSQMTILLAKTDPSKGVSAFLAPMRRHNPSIVSPTGVSGGSELNGVTIQRLKHKLGTQSLPTAELELNNMRGWLIGEEGQGIREISTILTITRVHTTVSSVGYLGRALSVAKGFALVREVGVGRGRRLPLSCHPLHMRTLANITTHYHGLMLLVYYTVSLLGQSESSSPLSTTTTTTSSTTPTITSTSSTTTPSTPPIPLLLSTQPPSHNNPIAPLLRILSSLHKSHAAHTTIPLLYGCLQSLGGVGYLLNDESQPINVARLFRDGCVGAVWEGTTDVLAGDALRVLKHPLLGAESVRGLGEVVEGGLGVVVRESGVGVRMAEWGEGVRRGWEEAKGKVELGTQEELLPEARGLVFRIAEVLVAVLYLVDAVVQPGEDIEEMCRRYLVEKGFIPEKDGEGRRDLAMDQAIVYGAGKEPGQGAPETKL